MYKRGLRVTAHYLLFYHKLRYNAIPREEHELIYSRLFLQNFIEKNPIIG